jgi:proline iminopeptidase
VQNAWDLHKAWPQAKLVVSPNSGHSAYEAENAAALVEATDSFR